MLFHRTWATALLTALALLGLGVPYSTAAPGPGVLVVGYQPAQTQADLAEQQFLQQNQVLEDAAAHVNALIGLPRDVPLVAQSCDEANASWNPRTETIEFCYGYVGMYRSLFGQLNTTGTAAQQARETDDDLIGFSNRVVFHEFGHALIDVLDLAPTGREEDVVDQLAILLLTGDSVHREYAESAIQAWGVMALATERGDVSGHVSDVHSLNSQRYYNALCWLYGSDPAAYQGVVQTEDNPGGSLPQSRAAGCQEEFAQIDKAWSRLLQEHLKQ
ncbi:DUF4344 domain-containing metallopeptidase [Streptomyces sp. NPDC056222]|uniref:DUF4344 domain-containing metallopeptidase n=1 Tax=Streptomyces sp. NPDC056222 TaxID=3345749 RepID=UPI0035DDFD44